jgi:hypothetical protein
MQEPNQTNCTQVAEMLDAFRDMELELSEMEIVETHLAVCPMCRKELEAIEMVVASLKSLPELPVKDFADAIEARINERLKSESLAAEMRTSEKLTSEKLISEKLISEKLISEKLIKEGQNKQPTLAVVEGNVRSFASPSRLSPVRVRTMLAVAALLLCGFVAAITLAPKPVIEVAEVAQGPGVTANPAQSPDKRLVEADKGAAPLSEDIVALYDEEGSNNVSDVGIRTNEDGLYAIKM